MCVFDRIFLCAIRDAKLIDWHHSNPNYPYHSVVKKDQIKFYSKDAEDPDFLFKMALVLMIVVALEL